MTFAANKELPKNHITTLVRLRPRKRLTGWVEDDSDPGIYRVAWSENVVGLLLDSAANYLDEEDSEAACLANADSFFLDTENDQIVLNSPTNEPNAAFTVVEWDVRLASRDLNWFVNPMDSSSGDARWEGGLVQAPAPQQGNPDLIFGYSPVQITSLQVQTADGFLFEHLHGWSLRGSAIEVWLCIGELRTENISELFTGVGGNMSMQGGVLSIDVQDPLRLLDADFEGTYFSADDFPNIADVDAGLPIREIFGFMRSFLPMNVDYNETAATNVNRDWVVSKGSMAESAARTVNIVSAPSGTSTFVDDAEYLTGGNIIIEDGGVDKYALITSVNVGTGEVQHTDIGARSFTAGDQMHRGFVPAAFIRWELIDVPLKYGRDYTEVDMAADTRGIVLADNFEANIVADGFATFPTFDPALMTLWVEAYGSAVLPKKFNGIDDFGALTERGGTAGHPVVILWDIIRNRLRTFREIVTPDETAWQAMALAFDRSIGLAVPETKNGQFPSWKEVVQLLLQTELLRMHFNVDGGQSLLTITQTSPTADGGRVVSELELSDPSYSWDTSDVYSTLAMQLNLGEMMEGERTIDADTIFIHPDLSVEFSPLRPAAYLHRVSQTFRFRSLFPFAFENESDLVAMRLAKLIGDRRGTLSGFLPAGFLEESIDDDASVQLKRLTGFVVSDETRTRNYKLAQHTKSAQGVSVILDDQKGIEDSGRW